MNKMSVYEVLKLGADKAVELVYSELGDKEDYYDCGPSDELGLHPTMGSCVVEALGEILKEEVGENVTIDLGSGDYRVMILINQESYSSDFKSSMSSQEFAKAIVAMLQHGKNSDIFVSGSTLDSATIARSLFEKDVVSCDEIDYACRLLQGKDVAALIGEALKCYI